MPPAPAKQAVHALVLRGQALDRIYHLDAYAGPSTLSPAKASAAQSKQAIHALVLRGQALGPFYHLGRYAYRSTSKVKTSTALKPTAIKIAANPTGGSTNKVQQLFSIH